MPIIFEIVHRSVSIQIINGLEVLSDSYKNFTFVNHICSFTSMAPKVFFVWQTFFAHAYEVFTTIHKYLIIGNHSCSLTSMISVFLVWQTYFFFLIMPALA